MSLEREKNLDDCHIEMYGRLNPMMMYLVIYNGHFGKQIVRSLLNKNISKYELAENILAIKCKAEVSALHRLMIKGNEASLRFYVEWVFVSGLDSIHITELLIANKRKKFRV